MDPLVQTVPIFYVLLFFCVIAAPFRTLGRKFIKFTFFGGICEQRCGLLETIYMLFFK